MALRSVCSVRFGLSGRTPFTFENFIGSNEPAHAAAHDPSRRRGPGSGLHRR